MLRTTILASTSAFASSSCAAKASSCWRSSVIIFSESTSSWCCTARCTSQACTSTWFGFGFGVGFGFGFGLGAVQG